MGQYFQRTLLNATKGISVQHRKKWKTPTDCSEGDRKVNNNSPTDQTGGDHKVNNNSPTDQTEGDRKVNKNHLLTRQREKILVLSRQIYTLRGIKLDISIDKTTTQVLVFLEREIMKIINIMYRYKLDQVEELLIQIVLDKQPQ